MNLAGIFESKNGNYYWMNCLADDEIERAKYFVNDNNAAAYHECMMSMLYDDMTEYVDSMQSEYRLAEDELYVVVYFEFDKDCWGLAQSVDFGITKQEIIENVKAQKYVEGASYFTMGQMFKTTRDYMNGEI